MKFRPIEAIFTSTTLVVAALALTGCATTSGGMSRHDVNTDTSPHCKEQKATVAVPDEEPPKDLKRAGETKRKKMTPEERRKLVEFYKELNAVS
jgi:hypothetical protein